MYLISKVVVYKDLRVRHMYIETISVEVETKIILYKCQKHLKLIQKIVIQIVYEYCYYLHIRYLIHSKDYQKIFMKYVPTRVLF